MLRVAFIGAGQMARHHVQAISRTGDAVSVVGVHDRMTARAEELASFAGCLPFSSIDALIADGRPDVIHVCTPPEAHFEGARAALAGGAHVYVEKPFALSIRDAKALLELGAARRLLVCAGHQLLRDPAFEQLTRGVPALGTLVQVDSHFAFRPAKLQLDRSSPAALARELIDILPHPLYALVAMLERFGTPTHPVTLQWCHADAAQVHALVSAGPLVGRLSVTLRGRPVASTLTAIGTGGSLTADFVRSIVVGAANPGTVALEKVFNPILEGTQLVARTVRSVFDRVRTGNSYPGLAESISAFHRAVAAGGPPPLTPDHLLRVTDIFETIVAHIERCTTESRKSPASRPHEPRRVTVITGASGFLGSEVARLVPHSRGVGRTRSTGDGPTAEWVPADLAVGLRPDALQDADVVVHAAAETSGGYKEHQRNTLDATSHLLAAMHAAGVNKLVLVSSLSVLRPPRSPWERQDEQTPRPSEPGHLGPYAWGKTKQEELVAAQAAALGIQTRIIRPGALIDWRTPELPGLVGKQLFGPWHLGLGRPSLPAAVCDVRLCAQVIAWCVRHFDEAPAVVNLLDDAIQTRGELIASFRSRGWAGRVMWVPIPLLAAAMSAARTLLALAHGHRPERLDVWSVLRPRRYNSQVAAVVLGRARTQHTIQGVMRETASRPAV